MPTYTYVGDDERYYTELGVTASPEDAVHELAANPGDGRWTPEDAAPPAPPADPAPVADEQPAPTELPPVVDPVPPLDEPTPSDPPSDPPADPSV